VERHRSSTGAPFVLHHGASIVVAVVATTVYSFAGKKRFVGCSTAFFIVAVVTLSFMPL